MLKGVWFEQGSAQRCTAELAFENDAFMLQVKGGKVLTGLKSSLQVMDRLGRVERKILLDDGSVFGTMDNDGVDQMFQNSGVFSRWIHRVESQLAWVMVALIVTIASGYSFFVWGVPWTGKQVAEMLPHEANLSIAKQSFGFLDNYILKPSYINEERQLALKTHFKQQLVKAVVDVDSEVHYKLHFRRWNAGELEIPNALALPSGDIILTDKFIELAKTQQEIDAVLLHEMGHVEHRHSLQALVETTLVATAIMMVSGDSSGFADMGVGLASLLVSSHYSRQHETDADRYAFEKMLALKRDPEAFSTIMARMEAYGSGAVHDKMGIEQQTNDSLPTEGDQDLNEAGQVDNAKAPSDWLDYLSTHPNTAKRTAQAERYHQCYLAQKWHCPDDNADHK